MTYVWLVEEFGREGNSTGRYMLDMGSLAITYDVYAARRLRRQMSAGFRALDMKEKHGGDWRPVEHGFEDSETPNRQAVTAAARYAIRGATMCGQDEDFDPDALVLNLCYALCGPAGGALLPADTAMVDEGGDKRASDWPQGA